MDKDTENCLSPNLFHYLLPNIRRMDPTRFAFREHDEIERIEKGKRAFWNVFVMQRKKPIRCEISNYKVVYVFQQDLLVPALCLSELV